MVFLQLGVNQRLSRVLLPPTVFERDSFFLTDHNKSSPSSLREFVVRQHRKRALTTLMQQVKQKNSAMKHVGS
jgi:hypothetical protein